MNCPNCGYELKKPNRVVPEEYEHISAWGYFGYRLLFSIPIVGFILLIVFSAGATKNRNLRSYARSYWCSLIIVAVIVAIIVAVYAAYGVSV